MVKSVMGDRDEDREYRHGEDILQDYREAICRVCDKQLG